MLSLGNSAYEQYNANKSKVRAGWVSARKEKGRILSPTQAPFNSNALVALCVCVSALGKTNKNAIYAASSGRDAFRKSMGI